MTRQNYPVTKIGTREQRTFPVSFETSEQGTFSLPALGFRAKVVSVETVVQKALGASDDGTLTLKNDATTVATVTLAASAAIGDEDSAPSVSSPTFESDEQMKLTTSKSTAGGKALAVITYEILPHSES